MVLSRDLSFAKGTNELDRGMHGFGMFAQVLFPIEAFSAVSARIRATDQVDDHVATEMGPRFVGGIT